MVHENLSVLHSFKVDSNSALYYLYLDYVNQRHDRITRPSNYWVRAFSLAFTFCQIVSAVKLFWN